MRFVNYKNHVCEVVCDSLPYKSAFKFYHIFDKFKCLSDSNSTYSVIRFNNSNLLVNDKSITKVPDSGNDDYNLGYSFALSAIKSGIDINNFKFSQGSPDFVNGAKAAYRSTYSELLGSKASSESNYIRKKAPTNESESESSEFDEGEENLGGSSSTAGASEESMGSTSGYTGESAGLSEGEENNESNNSEVVEGSEGEENNEDNSEDESADSENQDENKFPPEVKSSMTDSVFTKKLPFKIKDNLSFTRPFDKSIRKVIKNISDSSFITKVTFFTDLSSMQSYVADSVSDKLTVISCKVPMCKAVVEASYHMSDSLNALIGSFVNTPKGLMKVTQIDGNTVLCEDNNGDPHYYSFDVLDDFNDIDYNDYEDNHAVYNLNSWVKKSVLYDYPPYKSMSKILWNKALSKYSTISVKPIYVLRIYRLLKLNK